LEGRKVKITEEQLKEVIKEEIAKMLSEDSRLPGIIGPEAVASKILHPVPARLGQIAAAAGMRSGSRYPHTQDISKRIEEYIKTVCAPAIVKIVATMQGEG
jgi:hypothetical protein